MTKGVETMFVGFVYGTCERILASYRDDIPKEVYDSLVEMRDSAKKISASYYEGKKNANKKA